jgi:membrane protein
MAFAAGLSFYFLLSLFPMLISAAATLAYLPIPNLFNSILDLMGRLVPGDAMTLVRQILSSILSPPRGGLLSLGFLGSIWAASGGFSAMMEALDVSYDVQETRPYYKTRSLAALMTFVVGFLVVLGLGAALIGPRFGEILQNHHKVGPLFAMVWPFIRWGIVLFSVVLAIEVIYFWAPNVKQRFWHTLPGALFAVGVWIAASLLLGIYIRDFANYNATYGTLGGVIGLMMWFYVTALAILIGGEINAELIKVRGKRLPVKEVAPARVERRVNRERRGIPVQVVETTDKVA